MRYIQRIDNKPFEVASDEVTRWACCDCGLVHDIAFAARGKTIGVAARVNRRATAARRRSARSRSTARALRQLTNVTQALYDSFLPGQKPHDLDGPLADAHAALQLDANASPSAEGRARTETLDEPKSDTHQEQSEGA